MTPCMRGTPALGMQGCEGALSWAGSSAPILAPLPPPALRDPPLYPHSLSGTSGWEEVWDWVPAGLPSSLGMGRDPCLRLLLPDTALIS